MPFKFIITADAGLAFKVAPVATVILPLIVTVPVCAKVNVPTFTVKLLQVKPFAPGVVGFTFWVKVRLPKVLPSISS